MEDLVPRLTNRVQLTTDGHSPYLDAVEGAFGGGIDYAQIIKNYSDRPSENDASNNGNLPEDTDFIRKLRVEGKPDEDLISTSFVERQNLTMRMAMRRFTRRTNGFSKKAENHKAAVALHIMHYNFCRIHESLRVTPAMEAGVTSRLWDTTDIVKLIEDATPAPGPRGSYIANAMRRRAIAGIKAYYRGRNGTARRKKVRRARSLRR